MVLQKENVIFKKDNTFPIVDIKNIELSFSNSGSKPLIYRTESETGSLDTWCSTYISIQIFWTV